MTSKPRAKGTPHVSVGFKYADAVRELQAVFPADEIAAYCGFKSRGSIQKIKNGAIPSHPEGEAIYVMYFYTFGRKPPMTPAQKNGVTDPKSYTGFLKRRKKK